MAQRGPRGLSEESVRQHTGKSSAQWNTILDRFGAKARGHTASARFLEQAHGVDGWWAQAVTIRYEYARGLRSDTIVVPADLRRALAKAPGAKAAFERLAPSHRREYVSWIEEAKRPETRARRLAQAIARLTDGQRDPRPAAGSAAAGPRAFSDERVRAQTGKTTAEWNRLLDRWGARRKGHTATARYLAEAHGLSGWWAQMVAVRYEYVRGLRGDDGPAARGGATRR